jgi:hypothetical protein
MLQPTSLARVLALSLEIYRTLPSSSYVHYVFTLHSVWILKMFLWGRSLNVINISENVRSTCFVDLLRKYSYEWNIRH